LTPDPRYLLLTPAHREALSNVDYGIAFRRSCTLLLGGAGTAKTTILRTALGAPTDSRGARLQPIYVNNPTLTRRDFLEMVASQPEVAQRLNEPGLRQLNQRVALRCTLPALTPREVAAYVAGRLRLAGGDPAAVFTRDAILAISHHSGGIPRTISVICDNALL